MAKERERASRDGRPKYVSPVAVRMEPGSSGSGACFQDGSGDSGDCQDSGHSALGDCNTGNSAAVACPAGNSGSCAGRV